MEKKEPKERLESPASLAPPFTPPVALPVDLPMATPVNPDEVEKAPYAPPVPPAPSSLTPWKEVSTPLPKPPSEYLRERDEEDAPPPLASGPGWRVEEKVKDRRREEDEERMSPVAPPQSLVAKVPDGLMPFNPSMPGMAGTDEGNESSSVQSGLVMLQEVLRELRLNRQAIENAQRDSDDDDTERGENETPKSFMKALNPMNAMRPFESVLPVGRFDFLEPGKEQGSNKNKEKSTMGKVFEIVKKYL